jgi:hypothetical protein
MKRGSWNIGSVIAIVAVAVLLVSFAVPAAGGPNAVSAVSALKLAKKALKKANAADKRSKQALKEARGGSQGPPGPAGSPGPAGVPGAASSNAFGSLTYVDGPGGTTGATGYAFDAAVCPLGQAPTGGSFSPVGSELGGNDPLLGDYGDYAIDIDDPPDGFIDAWIAWAFNSVDSAQVYASAVCAPAGSAGLPARARPNVRAARLLEFLRTR